MVDWKDKLKRGAKTVWVGSNRLAQGVVDTANNPKVKSTAHKIGKGSVVIGKHLADASMAMMNDSVPSNMRRTSNSNRRSRTVKTKQKRRNNNPFDIDFDY